MDVSSDPKHPFNLPAWRKIAMLLALSIMTFVCNLEAAAHLTAFPLVAKSLHGTIPEAANSIGIAILGLGTGPLLWNPLSAAVGRRPVYIGTWILFMPCIVWCATATSMPSFFAARFLGSFCASTAQTIPAVSITEVWSPKSRGMAIAAWTLAMIFGPLIAPLICAAIIVRPASWRWMYWLCLILAGFTLILLVLFVPETLYTVKRVDHDGHVQVSDSVPAPLAPGDHMVATDFEQSSHSDSQAGPGQDGEKQFESGSVQNEKRAVADDEAGKGQLGLAYYPWQDPSKFFKSMVDPLRQALYLPILISSVWNGWIFCMSVGKTVVTPRIFENPPFSYKPVVVGTLFIASIIGAVIGKFVGGSLADLTITTLTRRSSHGRREPELRLPALIIPTAMVIVGTVVYGDGLDRGLHKGHNWVQPIIGSGIFYFGLSAVQGIVQTYCVEVDLRHAGSTILVYNLIKCVWGFAAPFFIPPWVFRGPQHAYIIQGAVAAGSGYFVIIVLLIAGRTLRKLQGLPMLSSP
ncbi:hypothetical protein OC846_001215 [Tilletia horrida]|uniref:Major facilitator superfamily (MFS) profile domain-containing protein n=1 Tax=Tilletia horrida TaxID=155126 RepID=A0AAN6GWS9_9BASI|nr:hypothetical protein OC845_000245 [Tilletia horrida]KAK0556392.1 hypothetical protein OC846_001215 [Tilletia horrida]KAK0569292.1 hypothetical protein OC861_001107 [Tilletia horrida]